jgi:hypothetical protein
LRLNDGGLKSTSECSSGNVNQSLKKASLTQAYLEFQLWQFDSRIAGRARRPTIGSEGLLDDRFHETKSHALARVAKPYPEVPPPSLQGAFATKQSIVRCTWLWIASLTGRRLAPSRCSQLTVDVIDMIRASKSLNERTRRLPLSRGQSAARLCPSCLMILRKYFDIAG